MRTEVNREKEGRLGHTFISNHGKPNDMRRGLVPELK